MTFIPAANLVAYDWQKDVYPMDVRDIVRLAEYDQSGNSAYLPVAGDSKWLEFAEHLGRVLVAMNVKIAAQGTTEALGSRSTYYFTYSDLGSDKTLLTYSTHGISPKPLSVSQCTLFKNGQWQAPGTHFTYTANGLVLTTAAVSGDTFILDVLSPDLARARYLHEFMGDTGTGVSNKTWDMDDLPADLLGESITAYPASSSRLAIFLNGMRCTASGASPDYTITGTGSSSVVTFVNGLSADDRVLFEIWSV